MVFPNQRKKKLSSELLLPALYCACEMQCRYPAVAPAAGTGVTTAGLICKLYAKNIHTHTHTHKTRNG